MARVKLPLSAAGRGHDMGGQPGGPVPIDPQGQPVLPKTGRLALLLSQLLQAGWVNGLWMNPGMRVNVCLQKIIWPMAIMKNG